MRNLKCRKIQKKNKGITLIALIITVIVLLILAGTAIGIAINGESLFGKASEARDSWNEAVVEEDTELSNYLSFLDAYSGTKLVDMFKNGLNCDKDYLTCTDETHLHIGDYVEYKPSRTDRSVTLTLEQTGVEGTQI